MDRIHLAHNREKWRANTVMELGAAEQSVDFRCEHWRLRPRSLRYYKDLVITQPVRTAQDQHPMSGVELRCVVVCAASSYQTTKGPERFVNHNWAIDDRNTTKDS